MAGIRQLPSPKNNQLGLRVVESLQRGRPCANLIHPAHVIYHAVHHDGRPDTIY
jgi:hypothetical protein